MSQEQFRFIVSRRQARGVLARGVRRSFPAHGHDSLTLGVIDRGRQDLAWEGGSCILAAGDGFVLPPGLAHSLQPGPEGVDYRVISLDWPAADAPAPGRIADASWAARFDGAWAALDAAPSDTPWAALVADAAAWRGRWRGPAPLPAILRRALHHLRGAIGQGLALDRLAVIAGASPFHLHRLFRQGTGLTPHGFLVQARLREARRRLESGAPVADVAAAAGFADQSHLTRSFKRFMGIPPGLYRRQTLAGRPRGNTM